MSRRLFAVALLPDAGLAGQVRGLRAALGDPRLADLPTHLTLVPPVDLDPDGVALARRVLRDAAAAVQPFELGLGPASSFAPRTSTLHLSVTGELAALGGLRDALRRDPWDRPDHHEFVPHVTLLQRADAAQVRQGLSLLGASLGSWSVHALHLLERLRPDGGPVWHPVAEEPLGGPRLVGRGGVELALRTTSTVEPATAELVGLALSPPLPAGRGVLVATAEAPGRAGAPLGGAVGRLGAWGAVLDHLVVDPAHRRRGIARHVLGAFCDAAERNGAGVVLTVPEHHHDGGHAGAPRHAAAEALGFRAVDGPVWCRRIGPLGELGSPR